MENSTFMTICLYVLQVCIVLIQYIAFACMLSFYIPFAINLCTQFCVMFLSGSYLSFSVAILAMLMFFSMFCYFFWASITLFVSFFSELWSSISIKKLKESIEDYLDVKKQNKFFLVAFLLLFPLNVVLLFTQVKLYGSVIIVTLGLMPTFLGFFRIIMVSWIQFIKMFTDKNVTSPLDQSLFTVSTETSESEKSIFIRLLDPSEISFPQEWINYIINPESNSLLGGIKFNWSDSLGYLNGLIGLVLIINIFYSLTTKSIFIGIFALITFPFCIFFNMSVVFKLDSKIKKVSKLYFSVIFSFLVIALALIFVATILYVSKFVKPPVVPDIDYFDSSNTSTTVPQYIPPICSSHQNGIPSLDKIAALNTLPRLLDVEDMISKPKKEHENTFNSTMKYVFGRNIHPKRFLFFRISKDLPSFALIDLAANIEYILFSGIESTYALGVFLQNYIRTLIPSVMDYVIPFYSFLESLIPGVMSACLMGSKLLMTSESLSIIQTASQYIALSNRTNTTVLIGQSIGANLVKDVFYLSYFDHKKNIYAFAFDGLTAETFDIVNNAFNQGSIIYKDMLYNIYSDSSILGSYDTDFGVNIHMPNIKSITKPLNVYDSFCMMSAKCADNDRFVHLCQTLLNQDDQNGTAAYEKMVTLFSNYQERKKNN